GRLVIIDRRPDEQLLPRSGEWKVTTEFLDFAMSADPAQVDQMTEGVKPIEPSQPTLLTREVEAVMPSRYFAAIKFFPLSKDEKKKTDQGVSANEATDEGANSNEDFDESTSFDSGGPTVIAGNSAGVSPAPVVHLSTSK